MGTSFTFSNLCSPKSETPSPSIKIGPIGLVVVGQCIHLSVSVLET